MAKDMDKILAQVETGKWNYLYFIGIGGFPHGIERSWWRIFDTKCGTSVNNCNFTHNATSSLFGEFQTQVEKCSSWDFMNDTFSSTITSDVWQKTHSNYWISDFYNFKYFDFMDARFHFPPKSSVHSGTHASSRPSNRIHSLTPEIRKRTLLVYVDFIVASTVYYGLSLNSKNFAADPFIYMMLTGLMEVPAYTLTAPIVARFGRRTPTSVCYSLCGVTILILAFIPSDPAWLVITLAMIGKLCISSAYQILYLISSEIFPTEVRLQGLGTSNLVARIGAASSPFITDLLGASYPWAPSLVFGSAGMVAGVATLLLPETLNKPMPETIYQLENQKINMELKLENLPENS
ncbi:Organic cation transporter protein [Armadillidium vulgare]|nr:Organic cation transporter protein [Armadillidium vulgare]